MNNEITPAQNARHMMRITDHEPRMNQLMRGLLLALLLALQWIAMLVRAAMVIPPTLQAQ